MNTAETAMPNKSEICFSTPSQTARKLYYYPLRTGHFFCEKIYRDVRKAYRGLFVSHVIAGSFTYIKDGRKITAHAGDTVIWDCRKPHEYCINGAFESVWLYFSGANSFDLFAEIERTERQLLRCRDFQRIRMLLFRIHNAVRNDAPPSELSISLDIYKLFAELLAPKSIHNKSQNKYAENMQKARQFILEHIHEKITVQQLAAAVHMSASHFSRVFKQQTGFSPYDYVLFVRLNKAKELLQKTEMTVASIAYETGFNSESNFISFFTESEGISPGKFRKLAF